MFPHVFKSKTKLREWSEEVKITHEDILIYTDGSHKKNERGFKHAAGAGIAIFHKQNAYLYSKALGLKEILFAEQFAIAQIFPLLKELKILTVNKRIIICKDNEATINILHNDDKTPTYLSLMTKIKQEIYS